MRLAKHVKIISSHLENLEDLKSQLGNLLEYIEKLINEGQSWIDEKECSKSFSEMIHFLTSETTNCIMKCLNIAYENDESSLVNAKNDEKNAGSLAQLVSQNYVSYFKDDTDYKDVKTKLDKVDSLVTNYSTLLHEMKETIKNQEQQNEIVSSKCEEKSKKTGEKFEEIIKELHAASDFMSHLQSQSEMMSNMKTENEKRLESRIRKLVELEEQMKMIIAGLDSEKKLHTVLDEIERKMDNLSGSVQILKQDFETKLADISSEVGNLKRTKKISFSVTFTHQTQFATGSVIKYDRILTNIGDSYNISTGLFTCPLDGVYVFHIGSVPQVSNNVQIDLYKNLEYMITIPACPQNYYSVSGNSVNLSLKKNDEICLKAKTGGLFLVQANFIVNTFSGFLLFSD